MGNRGAREFMMWCSDEAAWQGAQTEPRPAADDVHARGIGRRRLQLIECPSFEESRAWEIRQLQDEWVLFRSRVVETSLSIQLVGYDRVSIESAMLAEFYRRVTSLTLPLSPYLNDMGGLDGTTMQLAVFGDMYSEWRFQWWSESPPQWQPLVSLAAEMLTAFSAQELGGT